MARNLLHILLLLVLVYVPKLKAQDSTVYMLDTVRVKKGAYFIIEDQIIQVQKDTVLLFQDSIKYFIGNTDDDAFYRELKIAASKKEWSKKLYDFLIIEQGEEKDLPTLNKLFISSRLLNKHRNKTISDFKFKQLEVFGPSVEDTARQPKLKVEQIANKLHVSTQDKVIHNNLFLKRGEKLDLENIQDGERILRALPFIKDARIIPIDSLSSKDSVSLLVLTQDVFAYSFGIDFYGVNGGALEFNYNNFLGLGHQVSNRISYNRKLPDRKLGYGVSYHIPNIRRSFISAGANYIRHYNSNLTNIAISRGFISPKIKYAGGVDIGKRYLRQRFLIHGTEEDIDTISSTHNYQNLWLGRAFRINFNDQELSDRSRLIISGGYLRKKYSSRPRVTEELFREFQQSKLLIGSLSFSTRQYYRDRLVLSYGRTEDIPYGQKVTISGGHEKNEFTDRSFASLSMSMARFIPGLGYLYTRVLLESFFRNGKSEQGIIQPGLYYFSNLMRWGRYRNRNFLTMEFTRGINRFSNEFLTINRDNGIRGFESDLVWGSQRLNFNYELVAFSTANYIGFRFAPYFFYDASVLIKNNKALFRGKYYHGFGLGCRVRNDNLTFNTIEIRLGVYPNGPGDMGRIGFNLSEQIKAQFNDFEVTPPRVTPFN